MKDIYDIPSEGLSLAAGLLVLSGAAASFFYVRSRCLLPVGQQLTHEMNAQNALLADAFSRYRTLLEQINADRGVIIQCLRDFNQESSFLKNNWGKSAIKTYHSMDAIVHSPVQNELSLMRAELDLLMNTYPKSNIDMSMTALEINEAYDALKLHHSKVETIAEHFLPNLRSVLNEAKFNTKNPSC